MTNDQNSEHSGLVLTLYWNYFPLFFHISEMIRHWCPNMSELVLLGSVPGHSTQVFLSQSRSIDGQMKDGWMK